MNINWVEVVGYCGTLATIATYSMKTIVPLRIAGIVSSFFFITYATINQIWPMLATELLILPLNSLRLYQILRLMRQISDTPDANYLIEWLYPFSKVRKHKPGDIVFRLGETADSLFLVQSGLYRLPESGLEYGPGSIVGELGFVSHDRRRSMSLECVTPGQLGQVSYDDLKQLYFQNSKFGFFFLQLLGGHLVEKLRSAREELWEIKHEPGADLSAEDDQPPPEHEMVPDRAAARHETTAPSLQ